MLETLQQVDVKSNVSFLLQMSFLLIGFTTIVGFTVKKLMHLLFKF